jgi:hypothetical protein
MTMMPNQDDIAAQEALLAAHRQTLAVLLVQQAKMGAAYAPPALANGMAEARAAIARIKAALRRWGAVVEDLPDDTEAPSDGPGWAGGPQLPAGAQAGGDMIVGTVGAGAQGVAIGKHIQQSLGELSSADEDRRTVGALLARLDRDLTAETGQLDPAAAGMAAGYLRLLAGELTKPGERAAPSASTVRLVADWLLDNAPPLHKGLLALFADPATRRVLARADQPLEAWLAAVGSR